MLIAREKRHSNIAEYILYLWQVEDLLRALEFDPERITNKLVSQLEVSEELKRETADWYLGLAKSMKEEFVSQSGHLAFLDALVEELNDFHFRLIDSPQHDDYQKSYWEAVYNISDFRKKMTTKEKISDVEVCLTVLYGLMLMRMKKQTISPETLAAIETIRDLISHLSLKFRDFEEGKIDI